MNRITAICVLFTIAVAPGIALAQAGRKPWKAPARHARKESPVESGPQSIGRGKIFYQQMCAVCHGQKGHGDGPAAVALNPHPAHLNDPEMWQQTDGTLFWKIATGRNPMPGFRAAVKSEQIWDLVNYLRTLAPKQVESSPPRFAAPAAHRKVISGVFGPYQELVRALADEDLDRARQQMAMVSTAVKSLGQLDGTALAGDARAAWLRDAGSLQAGAQLLSEMAPRGTNQVRAGLAAFSNVLAAAIADFGHDQQRPVYLYHCPVTPDAPEVRWLQDDPTVVHPYPTRQGRTCHQQIAVYRARQGE